MITRRITSKEAKEAGEHFIDLLFGVPHTDEPMIIEEENRPKVVVISLETFQKYEAIRKTVDEQLHDIGEINQAHNLENDPKDMELLITDTLRTALQEHYQREQRRRELDALESTLSEAYDYLGSLPETVEDARAIFEIAHEVVLND